MIEKFAGDSDDSLWKKLAEEAVTKAVTTFVGEGVKAVIEMWKSRKMEIWKSEFKERQKARKKDAGDTDIAEKPEESIEPEDTEEPDDAAE